jgi:ATP adenylyltransferase
MLFYPEPLGEGEMKRLWAPWRMEFIGKGEKGCVFCALPKKGKDRDSLILSRGRLTYVVMNRYPYNNGHLMIAPYRHVFEPGDLTSSEQLELMEETSLSLRVLRSAIKPAGFNLGANLGRASGAGFDHLHFHVVPRWDGDTNFMPIIGEAKVIPEHLVSTYDKLFAAFSAASATSEPAKPSPKRQVKKTGI